MIRVSVWTAVFLILLRVCIGWHFAYEGYGKVKSAYQGKAAVNEKPFSSEAYFRESESTFGRLVKQQLPDPDQEVVDRLTLKAVEGDTSNAAPTSRFPDALAGEWDDYFSRYTTQFRLDEQQLGEARRSFDQAKANYVKWVGRVRTPDEKARGLEGTDKEQEKEKLTFLKVRRKAPGNNAGADYDDEVTPAERAVELKQKANEVRAAYARMEHLARDVDGANLRARKTEVNSIRTELQKEIDDQTKAMKDGLAKLFGIRVTAFATRADNKDEAATLQAMITPMKEGANPLGRMWDEYAAFVKDFTPNLPDAKKAEIDAAVGSAKERFDRWVAGRDPYSGHPLTTNDVAEWRKQSSDALDRRQRLAPLLPEPKKPDGQAKAEPAPDPAWLPAYAADALRRIKSDSEAELKTLTTRMQAELKTQSDAMRAQVGTPLLGEDRAKGYAATPDERRFLVVPKTWDLIDFIDWSTRWFLLVVGILLMVGLFTRLSCFAAAVFLAMTILTQPSVPWLPAPPVSEGNYLFVNKNVIEMVALLVLMTTRSGKWAGLDAIVCGLFGRRRRERAARY